MTNDDPNLPIFLTHENKQRNWPDVLKKIKDGIDTGVRVKVTEETEKRRDIQNRLIWRWIKIINEAHGNESKNKTFGSLKLDYLQPLKLCDEDEHERAMFENTAVEFLANDMMSRPDVYFESLEAENITLRDCQVISAFELIRSKNISVGLFATWLSEIKTMVESNSGLILTSSKDEIQVALDQELIDEYKSRGKAA